MGGALLLSSSRADSEFVADACLLSPFGSCMVVVPHAVLGNAEHRRRCANVSGLLQEAIEHTEMPNLFECESICVVAGLLVSQSCKPNDTFLLLLSSTPSPSSLLLCDVFSSYFSAEGVVSSQVAWKCFHLFPVWPEISI
jgi:hypothetical protein